MKWERGVFGPLQDLFGREKKQRKAGEKETHAAFFSSLIYSSSGLNCCWGLWELRVTFDGGDEECNEVQ